MYARLTRLNNGLPGLPVTEFWNRARDVTVDNVNHPRDIWRSWTDVELAGACLARVDDVTVMASGKYRLPTFSDTYEDSRVKRTYDLGDKSVDGPKRSLLGRINGHRDSIINAGIKVTIGGTTYVLQTDPVSRDNLTATVASIGAGTLLPDGFAWRMRDNSDVAVTSDDVLALGQQVFAHAYTAHAAARIHKAAVEALTTWAEIEAYDLSAGWPAVAPVEK